MESLVFIFIPGSTIHNLHLFAAQVLSCLTKRTLCGSAILPTCHGPLLSISFLSGSISHLKLILSSPCTGGELSKDFSLPLVGNGIEKLRFGCQMFSQLQGRSFLFPGYFRDKS